MSPAKGLCHVANQRLQDTSPVHSDCWLCFLPSVDIKSHQIHQPCSNYILKYVPSPQSLENIIFSSQDGLKIEQWLSFKALLQKHLLSQTVDTCTFLKCSKALSSEVKEKFMKNERVLNVGSGPASALSTFQGLCNDFSGNPLRKD